MLGFLLFLAISCVIMWLALMLAMLIVARFAGIGFPPLKDFLWKTAVVVVATCLVNVLLALIHPWLGFVGGFVAFLGLMIKLLDLDLWQCIAVVIGVWFVQVLAMIALLAVFHA